MEEIDLSVNDANDVQVLSDIDKDKNTDGKSEDDDQPVNLSVAHAKESREENLHPVDYSKPNANATEELTLRKSNYKLNLEGLQKLLDIHKLPELR